MNNALPGEALPSRDDVGGDNCDFGVMHQFTSKKPSQFEEGQVIGDAEIAEVIRMETRVSTGSSKSARMVVLTDGFEAFLDAADDGRYKITSLWQVERGLD